MFLVRSTSSDWNLNTMGNHRESVLCLWSTLPAATALGFITPSSASSLWGLCPPIPGVMDSFLVPFVFIEHARVDAPTLYPALRDPARLAFCTVGDPLSSGTTRSLLADYRWSSCPGGPALWYCRLSWVAGSVRSACEKLCPRSRPPCSYFSVVWRALLLPLPTGQIRLHRTAPSFSSWNLICPFGWHPTDPHDSGHLHCSVALLAGWLPSSSSRSHDLLYGHKPRIRLRCVMV